MLCSILKVSALLHTLDINLLTAIQLVEPSKKVHETMINYESLFDNIYKKVVKLCENNQIVILLIKNRNIY